MYASSENKSPWTSFSGVSLTRPEQVPGYAKLSTGQQKIFAEFLKSFYGHWEFPERHLPKKVRYVAGRRPYLRFECQDDLWFHVLSANRWY